jgi:hypothetical protein
VVVTTDAAPHPYHDDHGLIAWRPSWSAAVQEAGATGKPLYIEITHDDEEGAAFVSGTLVDKSIQKVLRRYFVCVVVDFAQRPPDLVRICKARNLSLTPINLFLSPQGEFLTAHQRNVNVKDFQNTLQAVLAHPRLAAAKTKEKEQERLTQTLAEALESRDGKRIQAALQAVEKVPGISPAKHRAYQLLDAAEDPVWEKLAEAGSLARARRYTLARVALEEAARLAEPFPVSKDVKATLNSLATFEEAVRLEEAKEPRWKEKVIQEYQKVLAKYPDSNLCVFAVLHLRALSKSK